MSVATKSYGLCREPTILDKPKRKEVKPPKSEKKSKRLYSFFVISNFVDSTSNVIASWNVFKYVKLRVIESLL